MTPSDSGKAAAAPDGKPPFPYEGPPELFQPIHDALRRVVDPEVAMAIVDVGLIYGVAVKDGKVHVTMTMTSAACPVVDTIMDDVEHELDRVIPPEFLIQLELVWDPPWSPAQMSDRARAFMGW
jgi:metal-sulfur cluster biosynthetic enzyme